MSRFKHYCIIFLFFASIFLALFTWHLQKELQKEQKDFKEFKNQSKELIYLGNKWNKNKNYKKILSRIKLISKPKKEITKGHINIFEFTDLSQTSLKRIIEILFNSNFNIQNFNIQKNNNRLTLYIEVKL